MTKKTKQPKYDSDIVPSERIDPADIKPLDCSIIAKGLGIREMNHPVDGGMAKTQGHVFDMSLSVPYEQQVIDILKPLKMRAIYTCTLIPVIDKSSARIAVRGLY